MKSKNFNLFFLFLVFQLQLAFAEQKPNIIVLYADDMGYGEIQALNPKRGKIPTPHLDQMIREGRIFSDAHTASSVCTPSRYALLTGRYAWRTRLQKGVLTGGKKPLIAQKQLTLATMLKEKGYATAMSGKWHLDFHYNGPRKKVGTIIPDGPITRGFDTWFGFHHAREMEILIKDDRVHEIIEPIDMLPRTTQFAVDYIAQRAQDSKKEQPFFLYVAFGSPHTPIVPTKEWVGKSGLGAYGDFVMMTDGMVGKILNALKQHGMSDNTLVIFSSDNGSSKAANFRDLHSKGHYPSAHLRGSKADLWDGGHRVPFILRWPNGNVKAGSESKQLIGIFDIMATCADIVDYKLPSNAAGDSLSFLPAFYGKEIAQTRKGIVHHSISGHFSFRNKEWKLLLAPGSAGWSYPKGKQALAKGLPPIQLYDMLKDPSEKNNLQAQHPEQVKTMIHELKTIVEQGRSTPGPRLANDLAKIDIWKKTRSKKK